MHTNETENAASQNDRQEFRCRLIRYVPGPDDFEPDDQDDEDNVEESQEALAKRFGIDGSPGSCLHAEVWDTLQRPYEDLEPLPDTHTVMLSMKSFDMTEIQNAIAAQILDLGIDPKQVSVWSITM